MTKENQEYLDEKYKELYSLNQTRIENGMIMDRKHLSLVNFCANFFQYGNYIHNNHGYRLAMLEPLHEKGIKNFDLAILKREINRLLLVECKYSISDINDKLNDISDAINVTNKNIVELEKILGNKIDSIEYIICSDGNLSKDIVEKILDKKLSLITWAFSQSRNELKLFRSNRETHGDAYLNHRIHEDEDFNKTLYNGIISKHGTTRLFKIMPSINMGVILTEINLKIRQMIEREKIKEKQFDFTIIYLLLEKELRYSTIGENEIKDLAKKIIKKAVTKNIFKNYKKEKDIKSKKYDFQISTRTAEITKNNTERNYININAKHKAEKAAIDHIRSTGRVPSLDPFVRNNR